MIDLVCILNENTYEKLQEAFPEVAWQRHRDPKNYDYWAAEVDHDLATEIAKVTREAGLSVGEEDAGALGLRKRLNA
jgi:hypothetical protein